MCVCSGQLRTGHAPHPAPHQPPGAQPPSLFVLSHGVRAVASRLRGLHLGNRPQGTGGEGVWSPPCAESPSVQRGQRPPPHCRAVGLSGHLEVGSHGQSLQSGLGQPGRHLLGTHPVTKTAISDQIPEMGTDLFSLLLNNTFPGINQTQLFLVL